MFQNLAILSFLGAVLSIDADVGEVKMAIREVSNITIATPSDVYLEKPFNQPISNFSIGIT